MKKLQSLANLEAITISPLLSELSFSLSVNQASPIKTQIAETLSLPSERHLKSKKFKPQFQGKIIAQFLFLLLLTRQPMVRQGHPVNLLHSNLCFAKFFPISKLKTLKSTSTQSGPSELGPTSSSSSKRYTVEHSKCKG
ncbi:hypothetical protein CEXT_11051 [Caerostris extrusa]|uniref:Uncharacterized protein n=1 Tax=Caerostris extrusa TaxID=172846 RepID=A0AAV4MDB0_CAEEX|nr:hypothetical protein CEXT_11051 [Caerostris extrusa]